MICILRTVEFILHGLRSKIQREGAVQMGGVEEWYLNKSLESIFCSML